MEALLECAVSPRHEMESYETVRSLPDATLKWSAELFRKYQVRPSELVGIVRQQHIADAIDYLQEKVREYLARLSGFSVSLHGTFQYPERLQDMRYPVELFYYRGDIGLTETPCLSVVGARNCTDLGRKRAARLARELSEAGYTIVSGLAAGIDTAAMTAAIEANGRTIGVIGTPINESYPKENAALQEKVAHEHLLMSQVPFFRYRNQPFPMRRFYFPERNETMAALSQATVIVEASERSGTHSQARACLKTGRQLFILNSCFENPSITWPHTYERSGAIRVKSVQDILDALPVRSRSNADVDEDRRDP